MSDERYMTAQAAACLIAAKAVDFEIKRLVDECAENPREVDIIRELFKLKKTLAGYAKAQPKEVAIATTLDSKGRYMLQGRPTDGFN